MNDQGFIDKASSLKILGFKLQHNTDYSPFNSFWKQPCCSDKTVDQIKQLIIHLSSLYIKKSKK